MKKVDALKAGDTIGVAASSSPFDRTKFTKGVRQLEKLGFKVFHRNDIFDQNRYLAGTDERRAEEFTELIINKNVKAVMFARGGYGSQRIIPLLSKDTLRSHSKPVIGFSDLTALLTLLHQSFEFPTFYGPVITQLGNAKNDTTANSLFKALSSKEPLGEMPVANAKTITPGSTSGEIVGGCLSLINSSIGTPYELNTNGKILFIEEVNEKVYVLDRMLTQLKNSGKLDNVNGIIFGSLIPLENEPHNVESMIRDVLNGFDKPVILGFPTGHIDGFVTLPLGVEVTLAAKLNEPPSLKITSGLLK